MPELAADYSELSAQIDEHRNRFGGDHPATALHLGHISALSAESYQQDHFMPQDPPGETHTAEYFEELLGRTIDPAGAYGQSLAELRASRRELWTQDSLRKSRLILGSKVVENTAYPDSPYSAPIHAQQMGVLADQVRGGKTELRITEDDGPLLEGFSPETAFTVFYRQGQPAVAYAEPPSGGGEIIEDSRVFDITGAWQERWGTSLDQRTSLARVNEAAGRS